MMCDLTRMTPAELLRLYAGIGTELRRRGIVRSENITGDMAEYLFCLAFGGRAPSIRRLTTMLLAKTALPAIR